MTISSGQAREAAGPAPSNDRSHSGFSLPQRAVVRTIGRLQPGYRQDVPTAVAAVARLRREAGRDPHASPTGWGLDDLADLADLREEQRRQRLERAEGQQAPEHFSAYERRKVERQQEREDKVVHLAVTLWALHQQSLRDEPMHVQNWSLGRAVRRLGHGKTGTRDQSSNEETEEDNRQADTVENVSEAVRKRFVCIGTSTDFEILGDRMRQIVLLLRSARIPLDYVRLVDQLFRWQGEYGQENVRREWGREFHLAYGPSPAARAVDEEGSGDGVVPEAASQDRDEAD